MFDAATTLAPMVQKLEYWMLLDDADRAALYALPHGIRTIDPNDYIVREGECPTHACLMLSGLTYRHKIVGTGARQIVSLHMSGDIVDLQNSLLGTADHNVQALTRATVAFIPRDAILQLAFERPAVGRAIWYDTLVDGAISREWIANLGRRDARKRLAHMLCEFALRLDAAGLGSDKRLELPMTQEQLGDCTGLTAVHVNRTLRILGKEGLITRTRRSVTVNDWKALAEAGDFEASYLHLPEHKLVLMR
ncbi:MAG TPA: Crp/Fnr family transcriptional regulator [Allosphingosinicella sp.]|nr:Crp/Fnr family transcriptional regulator [Allosphingosinicella sp.]